MLEQFNDIGFLPAEILIPEDVDFTKWSVVACDQYTSQPEYWQRVFDNVKGCASTFHITLPEIYLEDEDVKDKIKEINSNMKDYCENGVFKATEPCFVYVERTLKNGKLRRGLVGVVDLEQYDYNKGSISKIRATEGTVLERIPPRVAVRQNAVLEVPHIMLLIDDKAKTVIEEIAKNKDKMRPLYSFDLMENGGHIKGYEVKRDFSKISSALKNLEANLADKVNNPMLFAVGDGNHSLATAKECYERQKALVGKDEALGLPSRYALCELVNIHDDGLLFEPIHRVLFDVDYNKLISEFEKRHCTKKGEPLCEIRYITAEKEGKLLIDTPSHSLAVGTLQLFLDEFIKTNGGKIDYIHGEDVTKSLGSQEGNIGFVLPDFEKDSLFASVMADGVLPRKTFSMGEAHDKRFYLECRKIK